MKRSQIKRVTKEAKVLRHMRIYRGISMRKAGSLMDLSDSAINHYENGRMDLSPSRIDLFLKAYSFTAAEFEAFVAGNDIPVTSVREECRHLVSIVDESKLSAIYAVLKGFTT